MTSLHADGEHYRTHVYLGSARIADELNGGLLFNVTEPLTGSTRQTLATGATPQGDEEENRVEIAGLGTSMPLAAVQTMPPPNYAEGSYPGNAEGGCIDPELGPMPCSTAAAYQNYLGNLRITLQKIRERDNPRPYRAPEVVQVGELNSPPRGSKYDSWKFQSFPDDSVFADNQRHDHPGLRFAFFGRVDDREQWAWEPAFPPEGRGIADVIATAVDRAIDILQTYCWTDKIQSGIAPQNSQYAELDESFTNGWLPAVSTHARAWESPIVATHTLLITDPIFGTGLTVGTTFNFVFKYYAGQGAAVTYRTEDNAHAVAALEHYSQAGVGVANWRIAKHFLSTIEKLKCK